MKSGGEDSATTLAPPKLAKRRANKNSAFRTGRTIGERREKLETASERSAAREKVKKRQKRRIASTVLIYVALGVLAVVAGIKLFSPGERESEPVPIAEPVSYAPTIEIIDEEASSSNGHLTSRMKEYIGQAEADFRELGYVPTKVVVPTGTIREVDFYLDGYNGRIKLITDRGTGVSTEDADRMIRYLASIGVNDFEYIDVRVDGKAYWK